MDDELSMTFFEGWVGVYETFLLTNNMERFPADQNVRVWSSDAKTDETLLQDLTYHSSCSQNLDLCNRFGSQGKLLSNRLLRVCVKSAHALTCRCGCFPSLLYF